MFVTDVLNTVVFPSNNTHFEGVTSHYLTQDDSIDLISGEIQSLPFYRVTSALITNEF